MAAENCISDRDLPATDLRRCSGKRQRTSSEPDLPPTTISKLGTDLLVEILIRLPSPRSACQCKIVCKQWGSLICSPHFNRRFVSHHQTMNLDQATMSVDPYELLSVILSFLPPMPCSVRDSLRVLDCNKDLVLCGFWDTDCDDGEQGRSYLVCNPFTKQWIALPLAPKKNTGYVSPASRLVCEPRISNKLDLGDDQAFVYSEYRFRVVCIYQVARPRIAIKLDVFCSESGEWTKEALVCDGHVKVELKSTISCNGELFWRYYDLYSLRRGYEILNNLVAVFNPFRLDMHPTSMDISRFLVNPYYWFISASQGVFHVILQENETIPYRLSVWRLDKDRKSLIKQCEGWVNETTKCGNYEVINGCHRPSLHPHNPEVIFFNPAYSSAKNALFCCDLRRGELEFLAKVEGRPDVFRLQVFQPRVSCWATPIPRYAELRGMYDGTYRFWVQTQSSREARTPSLPSSLNIDEATKSALYKDGMEHGIEEATEIIQHKENGIRETVLRERQQPHFPPDKESDVLEADLKDVGANIAAISKPKELKHSLLCETSAERPPQAPITSVFKRWIPPHIRAVMLMMEDEEKYELRLLENN
ncbi:unnamed protein product [Linum tenue]|uniref:F-box domain-containing protein n=1 Tax=Linum tenue TaxID=586396 RepID=A0AAV0LXK0_9ROSI|nr:unnamed protein product [Linum tenue]